MTQAGALDNDPNITSVQATGFSRLIVPQRYPNNLPLQLTSFIGREREISAIKQLLWSTRRLTLMGRHESDIVVSTIALERDELTLHSSDCGALRSP